MNTIEIPTHIKALIFDLDGTIADNMNTHFKAWQKTFNHAHYNFTYNEFISMAGMGAKNIIQKINNQKGIKLDENDGVNFKEKYYIEECNDIKPVKSVMDLIKKFHGKIPMAIGTGSRKKLAKIIVDSLNLNEYFKIIVTANDVKEHKPNPETFLKCAKLLGINPKDCLVLEDGPMGIEAAIRAGMSVIDVKEYYDC